MKIIDFHSHNIKVYHLLFVSKYKVANKLFKKRAGGIQKVVF
jgi:hypothetical protein